MFFSVIIPVYQRVDLLDRALKSVYYQSFQDFECLVVVDGCKDNYHLLKTKYPLVTWIYSFPNKGVAFSRNLGAQLSQGRYLVFLDSDDEWLSKKLEKQYNYLEQHKVSWLHTNEFWFKKGQFMNQGKRHDKNFVTFERSLETCLISPSTVCLERNFFLNHLFDEDLKACEDYELWLRMFLKEKPYFIHEPLVKKHGGHEQLSQQHSLDQYRIFALKKLYSLSKKEIILKILLKKYEIFIQGAEKRGKNIDIFKQEYLFYYSFL